MNSAFTVNPKNSMVNNAIKGTSSSYHSRYPSSLRLIPKNKKALIDLTVKCTRFSNLSRDSDMTVLRCKDKKAERKIGTPDIVRLNFKVSMWTSIREDVNRQAA